MTDLSKTQMTAIQAAITPDHHSRSAYTGRVIQREWVTIISDDGTAFEKEVSFTLSWASISEILQLIKIRAGI